MFVSVLASGSEGNSTYIEINNTKILIDIGMNTKYIKEKLKELDVSPEEINYILITHTHKDHIGALSTFIKKYSPYIILTESMYNDLEILRDYDNLIISNDKIDIGNIKIDSFKLSHDTNDIRGFLIENEKSSLVYITDTGYINQKYFKKIQDKNIYIIEANHDIEKLQNGNYPKWLKTRILSDKGHLSNNATGFYLSKIIGPNTKKIILAHLSKENNDPDIAYQTVLKILNEYEIEFKDIQIAKQREITEMMEL